MTGRGQQQRKSSAKSADVTRTKGRIGIVKWYGELTCANEGDEQLNAHSADSMNIKYLATSWEV